MRTATNQIGHEVQRHDGPMGWQGITEPFATDTAARAHMDAMERTPGAEYRVYPALDDRGTLRC